MFYKRRRETGKGRRDSRTLARARAAFESRAYSFLLNLYLFILFLAALGLSLVEVSGGFSLAVVCGLLTAVVSFVEEHGLQGVGSEVVVRGLSCSAACGIFPHQA